MPPSSSRVVAALRDMGRAHTGDGSHRPEAVVEHIAPVAQHIENDAAAVLLAVVPGGALGRDSFAFENPVTEFAADRENAAEETEVAQMLDLEKAWEPELILHDAVFDARLFGLAVEIERDFGFARDGLFAIDVLARGDGGADGVGATVGGLRIEVDGVFGVGESLVEIGGPFEPAEFVGDGL